MRIAVVGATGRIGSKLTDLLLEAGHEVKALSRGGPGLDALVARGAEPVIGSFDTGAGAWATLFDDVEAAFLMVKTDWNNIGGHYPVVAGRFVEALRGSPVRLAVSLTSMGSEVDAPTGHFREFHRLDQKLEELEDIDLVHLRAAWFMENTLAWTGSVAEHGRIAWWFEPDLKMPWVATDDIAALAARELTAPSGGHRVVREVGSQDLTMDELAAIIAREIDRPVEYRFVDRSSKEVEETFLARFGSAAQWRDDDQSSDALNHGIVRFHGGDGVRPALPTTMEAFIRETWKSRYLEVLRQDHVVETFFTWSAR